MHFFYKIVSLCILVFNLYSAQVNALLNITEEALITSRRLLKEIEGKLFITNEDELYNKLNIITEIAYGFERKYDYEMQHNTRHKYNFWYNSENSVKEINAPLTFINILSKFRILKEKVVESQWIFNKHTHILLSNGTINKRPKEIFDREFPEFAKNKYNLIVKEKKIISLFYDENRYMEDVFNELYQLFFYTDKQSHLSIFEFLKNTTKYISNVSNVFVSTTPQLRLFDTIRDLIVGEAFFCVKHQYFVALVKIFSEASGYLKNEDRRALNLMQRNWGELDALNVMKMYEEKFELKSTQVFNKVKSTLVTLSRHFSKLISQEFDWDFTNLEVFAKYIINEVDLNADGTCKRTCSDYNKVERVFGCFDGGICSVHRKCKGKLWDCENIVEPMYICSWNEKNKEQRYTFIKHENYYPSQDDSSCPTQVKKAESWRRGFYKCSYCQCKCEETETYSDRYFSLSPATSNIYDNYVVVGIRFQIFDHVLHLQVMQAKLLPNGQLGSQTLDLPRTFNVTDYDVVAGKDFQAVTGDARTVCLDQLESPIDHLLTGVRLKFQDGYFKLEIRMTQFDYSNGVLFPEKSFWYSKDTDLNQRPKINLDEFLHKPKNSIKTEGCVQFTTNQGEHGDGQSTIPYIRRNFLYMSRIAPLSGVGMILRKGVYNAFLDFQLVNQDVAVYTK